MTQTLVMLAGDKGLLLTVAWRALTAAGTGAAPGDMTQKHH